MFARRSSTHGIIIAMMTVAALFVGLTGCIGRPDLSNRAEEIAEVIARMPGVDDVDDCYQNGFTSGQSLTYRVTMAAAASDDELVNVASTVNREAGDEFDDYHRELALHTPDISVVAKGEPDADGLRLRLPRLRALSASLMSGKLTWREDDDADRENQLEIQEVSSDPFTVLSAIRDQFGAEDVSVNFGGVQNLSWDVAFPYSVQAQNRLASALRALPQELSTISIDHDQVAEASATLDDTANAAIRLMVIIDRVDSGTTGPWIFRWSAGQAPTGGSNLATGGRVSIGACEYYEDSPRESDPAGHMTQEAIDVQDQLRAKYDTCG